MELNREDLQTLLEAARTEHRSLKRMRDDMVRAGITDNTGNDIIFNKQQKLAKTIEKLQIMLGIIPG